MRSMRYLPQISSLGRRGEFQTLSTMLTGLLGTAQTLGADALSHVITRMALANSTNDTRSVLSLIPELEKATTELKEAVQRFRRQIEPPEAYRSRVSPEEESRTGQNAIKR